MQGFRPGYWNGYLKRFVCKRIVNLNRIFNVRQVWEALVLVCFMPGISLFYASLKKACKPLQEVWNREKKIGQDILLYNAAKNFVTASAVESYFWEGFFGSIYWKNQRKQYRPGKKLELVKSSSSHQRCSIKEAVALYPTTSLSF